MLRLAFRQNPGKGKIVPAAQLMTGVVALSRGGRSKILGSCLFGDLSRVKIAQRPNRRAVTGRAIAGTAVNGRLPIDAAARV
jgi:hypothetical protein